MTERWSILHRDAIERWLDGEPSPFEVARVLDWLDRCQEHGPPNEGIQVFEDDELHATLVNRTSVVVTYLVVAHERLMVLKAVE